MISLQVNHRGHADLHSCILQREHSDPNAQHPPSPNNHQLTKDSTEPARNATATTTLTDKETQVISSIRATDSKLKQDLQELINDYKDSAEKLMDNHGYDPEREAAIRQHLSRLQREKHQRRAKFENDLAKLEAKKAALQQLPQKSEQEREERRKSIEARIQRIHEREQRRHQEEASFMQFYENYKAQKPKFKAMEEQFAKKEQHEKEEKMRKLKKKVEETYKPMNLEELEVFQEQYENSRYQAEKVRLQNQLIEKKKAEANQAKLNKLYKGHSHATVMRELEERHTRTDEPKEKIKRLKEYSELVREEYRPRVMSSCEDSVDETTEMPLTERGKRVLKERFLHGQYLGKKVEFEKTPLSHAEQITRGIQYLEFLKQMPKKPKKTTEKTETSAPPEPKRTVASVYRVARNRNPLYEGRRYNSIDFNSEQLQDGDGVRRMLAVMRQRREEMELEERVMKNRSYEDRQDFMSHQNRHNNNIYSSIKQKLAILSQL